MIVFLYVLLFGLSLWGVYLFVLLCNIFGIEKERSKNFSDWYRIYLVIYLSFLLLVSLFVSLLVGGALGSNPNYIAQAIIFSYFHLNAASLVFYWQLPFSYKWISKTIGVLAMTLPILSSIFFSQNIYNNSDFGFEIMMLVCAFTFLSIKISLHNYRRFIGIK